MKGVTTMPDRIKIIQACTHAGIVSELEHFMCVDREPEDFPEGYTLLDAWEDLVRLHDDNPDSPKSLRKAIREMHVALGDAIEVTDAQLSRRITVSLGGGSAKNYWFKLNGKKYDLKD